MKAYGYSRGYASKHMAGGIDQQRKAIEAHFADRLKPAGYAWAGLYTDAPGTRPTPVADREAGRKLSLALEPGDVLVIARTPAAFSSLREVLQQVRCWAARGVRVQLLDLGYDSAVQCADEFPVSLPKLVEFEDSVASERMLTINGKRTKSGKATNQYAAPYGFKLVGPRGSRRIVPDEDEAAVLGLIVRWKLSGQGYSWDDIYFHLREQKLKTRDGREWSRNRIRRCFVVALHRIADAEAKKLGEPAKQRNQTVSASTTAT